MKSDQMPRVGSKDRSSYGPVIIWLWSGYHPVIRPVSIRLSSIIDSCPSPTDSLISLRYSMLVFSANSFELFFIIFFLSYFFRADDGMKFVAKLEM